MGLDVWLEKHEDVTAQDPEGEKIEIDSGQYPDHLFKIGYFRSSYNSAGVNSLFRRIGVPDLYDIFNVQEESWIVRPDWEAVKERVSESIGVLDAKIEGGVHDAWFCSGTEQASSAEQAIQMFQAKAEQQSQHENSFRSFSCSEGHFWMDGLEVVAAIPGERYAWEGHGVFLIVKRDDLEWYRRALEIVAETADHVLEQDHPDRYYLKWSG